MASKKDNFTEIHVQMDNLVEDFKSITEQIESFMQIRDRKIQAVNEQYEEKVWPLNKELEYIKTQLRVLADQVPHKETKTQFKVSLLCGDVILKKSTKKIDYDKKKLLDFANKQIEKYKLEQENLCSQLNEIDLKIQAIESNTLGPDETTGKQIKDLLNKRIEIEEMMHSLSCPWIDFVAQKVTEDFKWTEFKANLAIQESLEASSVIDITTGEILSIDGLSVIEIPEELVIK